MNTVTHIKIKMRHYTTELISCILNNRKQKYPSDTVSQYYDYSTKMCHVEMSGLILQGSVENVALCQTMIYAVTDNRISVN